MVWLPARSRAIMVRGLSPSFCWKRNENLPSAEIWPRRPLIKTVASVSVWPVISKIF